MRHQSGQITKDDVVLDNPDLQAFMQTDVYDKITKDPQLRNVLSNQAFQQAMSNDAFRQALSNEAFRQALSNEAFRQALSNEAFRQALSNEAFRQAMSNEAFREAALERGVPCRRCRTSVPAGDGERGVPRRR